MKKIIVIILILGGVIISCEKDDICVDEAANTPHLVIKFLSQSPPQIGKDVPNLLIVGEGNTLSYGIESTRDSILVPLKVLENNTSFRLIKDYAIDDNGTPTDTSDDFAVGNEDIVTITYETEEIYISKACGFKTIFKNVNFGFTADSDNWIATTTLLTTTIENENNAHVYIYH